MKKLILISIVILSMTFAPKQTIAQDWLWANSAGGTVSDYSYSVATDSNGNVIVAGSFSSSTITFGLTTLTNVGGFDFFIVKYDASGNVLWTKSEGGVSNEFGYSVDTDNNGNVIVTGYFDSPSITFGTTTLTNTGQSDIFLVKYDASGNLLWAKSAGGIYNEYGNSVVTDDNGNVIVTGSFNSPSVTFDSNTLTNVAFDDIFIAKYDSLGNLIWVISEGGTNGESGKSIVIDANSNILVTGYFMSSSLAFGSTVLNCSGGSDVYIAKYDSLGNALWANSAGEISNDAGTSVATDINGNVIVTGYFFGPSITFDTITLNYVGFSDFFIVKYDSSGNVLWAKSTGGDNTENGKSVATFSNGDIIVTGHFDSPSIDFETTILVNAGQYDIFIVKYDASGNMIWAYVVGESNFEGVMSVAIDVNGNMFFTGNFNGSSNFGSTTLNELGGGDIYIAKLGAFTGVNELDNNESFSVYPNPSNGNYSLEIRTEKQESFSLEVSDIKGKIVFSEKGILDSGVNNLHYNWSQFSAGVYLVKVSTDSGMMNVKLVKN